MTRLDLTKMPYFLTVEEEEAILKQVSNMSTSDKVGQLFFIMGAEMYSNNLESVIKTIKPGGIMFRGSTIDEVKTIIENAHEHLEVEPFFSANVESGADSITSEFPSYGSPMLWSAANDMKLVEKICSEIGQNTHDAGLTMSFSPVVDLQLNPNNPITGTRSFGETAEQVTKLSTVMITKFLEKGVLPVLKHFPGDGVDNRDHHLLPSVNSLSTKDWLSSYGEVYSELIKIGAPAVMAGHIMLPDFEKKCNPELTDNELRPATLSTYLLNDLLKNKLQFNGVILTDASQMGGFNSFYPRAQTVVETIKAGCDMLLFSRDLEEDFTSLIRAVEMGELSLERLNEAVTKLLGLKKYLKNVRVTNELLTPMGQYKTRMELADKGITMVKNTIGFRKLTPKYNKKLLVLCLGNETKAGKILKQELTDRGFDVTFPDLTDMSFGLEMLMTPIVSMKKRYDTILYILDYQSKSNQTSNRLEYGLPFGQAMPNLVKEIPTVMVSFGNPYHLEDAPRVPVYMNAYSNEEFVITATIDKLMGLSEFKGVSPVDAFCGRFDTKCF